MIRLIWTVCFAEFVNTKYPEWFVPCRNTPKSWTGKSTVSGPFSPAGESRKAWYALAPEAANKMRANPGRAAVFNRMTRPLDIGSS